MSGTRQTRSLASSRTDESPGSIPLCSLPLIRRKLLRWFDRNCRALPWRASRDPYRIWVSEVMLQQTQVATVIPYYERFLDAFPTIADLAKADEQDVLKLWEGLGYYRRARDLHRAARLLVVDNGDTVPDDVEIWRELPGVGRYILGAVLSQAFDRRLPIVEANSKRVLCRLFGQTGELTNKTVVDWLWNTAEALLPRKRVGDFNQALMEFGQVICTSSKPRCTQCPLAQACAARKTGAEELIPTRPPPKQIQDQREIAVVVRNRGKVLLTRRPASGRWANMWEFPRLAIETRESIEAAAQRIIADLLGIEAAIGPELLTIRHSVTRFRITLTALEAKYRAGRPKPSYYVDARWLTVAELRDYPVSRPQRQLAEELSNPIRQRALF